MNFLDEIPTLSFPEEITHFFDSYLAEDSLNQISNIQEHLDNKMQIYAEEPTLFLEEYHEVLEKWVPYILSDEYKTSLPGQIKKIMKEFNRTNGYYDVFIPAMCKLSPSYYKYHTQLEACNKLLLAKYPELNSLE